MIKDTPDVTTHSWNDGCPEHSGVCSNCGRPLGDIVLLSPTIDPKKRTMCVSCATDAYNLDALDTFTGALNNDTYPLNTFTGETRRELQEQLDVVVKLAVMKERKRIQYLIVQEIVTCHLEGTPTSRLTSLSIKIDE